MHARAVFACLQEGGDSILLPDGKHSGFVPTPGKAIQLKNYPWYGDAATLKLWAGVLDEAEAQAEATAARQRRRQQAGILSYSKP
jgi:hypothetical protein